MRAWLFRCPFSDFARARRGWLINHAAARDLTSLPGRGLTVSRPVC